MFNVVEMLACRALLMKDGDRVSIRSRNNKELTNDYPTILAGAKRMNAKSAVVDGEIVAVDSAGCPSFQVLQHRRAQPGHAIAFYAFDVLHMNGSDLTSEPLENRRERLPMLLENTGLLVSSERRGSAAQVTAAVSGLGLEGVVAKRRETVLIVKRQSRSRGRTVSRFSGRRTRGE